MALHGNRLLRWHALRRICRKLQSLPSTCCSHIQAVYFIEGQPHDLIDLRRANVQYASHVMLFPPNIEDHMGNDRLSDPRKDTMVVLAYQHLKYLAPCVPVLTELAEGMNQVVCL